MSAFVPLAPSPLAQAPVRRARARRVKAKTSDAAMLTWCVLAVVLLLVGAVHFYPKALVLSPVQATPQFKMASGYAMLTLLSFAMVFGWLRRVPTMARHHRKLNEIHQLGGLLILVLLALHIGQKPAGFLLYMFHALAIGLGAGALRGVLGTRLGRKASVTLLTLHISLCCLVAAAVLLHVYFVYAYTA